MVLFADPTHPIDFLQVAKQQYGKRAELWDTPSHAYGWHARLQGDPSRYDLDIHGFVRTKFGKNWCVVQSSFEGYGWRRFDPFDAAHDWAILPVILVARDQIGDEAAIGRATQTYRHNIAGMAEWYASRLGRTFKLLEPQLFASPRTTAEWYAIYMDQRDRSDLWKACQEEVLASYSRRTNANIIYVVTQYCGDTPLWDYDAAGGSFGAGFVAVVSSFACCQRYDPTIVGSTLDKTVIYALGHEVGHCLGLPHPDDKEPGAGQSIMLWGRPPDAIFLAQERERLLTSPYLLTLA
jgi:hypothetical protein